MYKTLIVLPVILYRHEMLSLRLREKHKLRVFENKMLRRIFGSRTEEVAGDWRRLNNEGLHNMYALPNSIRVTKSRRMR